MTDVFTKRAIGHEEARECARRFIDGHFNNPGRERPRASIPARPDYDDDLLLLSYIKQQEAASPTPPISPNYREEVARAISEHPESSFIAADAAISTLQRLGWNLEQRDLLKRVEDAELALNIHDAGHTSEYWLRYPSKEPGKEEG